MVQYLEENLRGDVVWEVPDYGKAFRKNLFQPQSQKIGLHQAALHPLEMPQEIIHRLPVNLHKFKVYVFTLKQILCKYAHSRANLQGREAAAEGVHDCLCHFLVGQEMLAE